MRRLGTEKQLCGTGSHEQMSLRQRSMTRVELKSILTVGNLLLRDIGEYKGIPKNTFPFSIMQAYYGKVIKYARY